MREVYLFWFLRVILEWNVLRRRWELKLKGMWNLNGNIKILKKKRDKGGFLNVWVWFGNFLGMEVNVYYEMFEIEYCVIYKILLMIC